ncbi:hypothetical protein KHM83_09160 [Fusibacter paucivorans]|uniref:Sporulation related domain-containing protein n=1 Tax=Fusibacter paucivorans TaxID=76009 RepID=A0ABS5PNV1_9FIRM|nr:hypothetical protein [Fusibacter paucivorans]MBS7526845.1 hypothetical protein [Fusibacter paucivorans]
MGTQKNNQGIYRIFVGRAPGPFIVTLLVILLISGAIGYVGMSGILDSLYGKPTAEEPAAQNNGDGIEADTQSDSLETISVEAQEILLFTAQVSSLTDENAAKDAVGMFANEGLQVGYYHSGSYYKMVAGMTADEDGAKQYTKRIVEKYPKYKDAFSANYTMAINAFKVKADGIDSETLAKSIRTIIEAYSELITSAQVADEMNTSDVEALLKRSAFLDQVTPVDEADETIVKALKTFNGNIQKLVDRKANVGAYNQLWLNFVLSEAK